ncbi:hypothetical protein T492DRAFT_839426 [Pavlovales sp. CCMP2436]|nr:hypothetical protein T492DRAFT_839426 [Pavlovales sp. CCMP2436]
MNIENLRRMHIPGVRRTTDTDLMDLQNDLRRIITGSAGGIYVLGGCAENAIIAARRETLSGNAKINQGDWTGKRVKIYSGHHKSGVQCFQGITFENETLFIDLSYIWDVKMIYVAIIKPPICHGEGEKHREEKVNQYLEEIMEINTVIDEYPEGDGRYIADLAVFTDKKLVRLIEVVITNPPSKEKIAYYEELGIECKIVTVTKEGESPLNWIPSSSTQQTTPKPSSKPTSKPVVKPAAKQASKPAEQPAASKFMDDDDDDDDNYAE